MTSDELDWLVYSYLEESGYHHTAFSLLHESALAPPSSSSSRSSASPAPGAQDSADANGRSSTPAKNPVMDTVVPPGHLIRILQKGLLYLEAEARYRGDPQDQRPRLIGYPIPNSLPLPPLPKHVPPPPEPQPPAARPSPAASTSTAASAATTSEKGKGKAPAPPAASTAAAAAAPAAPTGAGKRKGPANVSDREDGAADGPKRPRTASGEAQASGSGSTGAAAAAAKKKAKPAAAENGKERDGKEKKDEKRDEKEKDPKGKGKARAVDDAGDGDATMADGTAEAGEERTPASAPAKKEKKAEGARDGEKKIPAAGPAAAGAKREREKKDDDLRPPAAKKTAAATSHPASQATASASASAPSTAATAAAAKRSTSPTLTRKPAPSASASSTATPSTPAASASAAPKFRITTQTKTVSTPIPPTSRPLSSSSTAANGAEKLMKVKQEGEPSRNGASSASSSSAAARAMPPPSSAGGGKKSGKDPKEAGAKEKEKKDRAAAGGKSAKDDPALKGAKRLGSEDAKVVKLRGHVYAKVQPCAFNPFVPSLLATGGGDSTCRIWDVPPPSPSLPSSSSSSVSAQKVVTDHIICKHASAQRKVDITAVAWDPSGSLLATGSEDGIARIWTPSGDLHLVLSMHMRAICSLAWSPSGTLLLTSSLDQTVCLWELTSGKVRQQYSTHADCVLDTDWLDESTFATASMDKTCQLMSTSRPTPLHRFRGHRDEVNVVKFSPCGTLLASCSDDGSVRIHSLRSIPAIAASVAARPVKKGDKDRKIDQDEEDGGGDGVWALEGHRGEVHQVAWHPKAGKEGTEGPRLVASCSFDHTARLWDADAGTCLHTFARATDYVYSISFEPQLGRWLATGSNDGRLEVWEVKSRTLALEYTHSGPIYELTWHPHGQQIAVCGQTEDVAVVAFEGKK
ncbi:hypothetical protein JCM10213v2_003042 [Rhodosporidiobolus nylandii]